MILLTKSINTLLEDNGLELLTITRNDDGVISLCGRACFKPVMSFTNMPVGKKLTGAERKILEEDYLAPVILKHKKELLHLIALRKDTTAQEKLDAYVKKIETTNISTAITYDKNWDHEARAYGPEIVRDIAYRIKIENYTRTYSVTYSGHKGTKNVSTSQIIQDATKMLPSEIKDYQNFVAKAAPIVEELKNLTEASKKHQKDIADADAKLATICRF